MPLPKSVRQEQITGRIVASGLLTDQQVAFVRHFAAGVAATESARMAGYTHPGEEAYRLRLLPHIRAAVLEEQTRRIHMDGAQLAWETMQRLMSNEETPPQVQYQCARWTLEAAGQGLAARAQRAGQPTPGGKSLHEMTARELEVFISEGRERLAQAAAVEIASEVVERVAALEPGAENMAGNGQETA